MAATRQLCPLLARRLPLKPLPMHPATDIDLNPRHLERLIFFSDAVFAIAITLLVIDIRLPELPHPTELQLGQALVDLLPNYLSFVISFLVIGQFWVAHHRLFGMLKAGRSKILRVNLYMLMLVAFMPFPTAVFSQHASLRVAIGFYTGSLVTLGLVSMWLTHIVLEDPSLFEAGIGADEIRLRRRRGWMPICIGTAAFAVGMIRPVFAQIFLAFGSPLVGWAVAHLAARRSTAADAG